jgi:endonuclease/exonuclease/phosphatase (EEP) superfamily protein YafD
MAWSRSGLSILVAVYLAVLVAAFVAIFPGSTKSGWPALLRELGHLLFVPVPFLLVLALLVWARLALLGLAVPLLAFAYCYGPQFSPREPVLGSAPGFRVLSFNAGASRGLGRPETTMRTIGGVGPDVICLVEAPVNTLATVGAELRDAYPYQAGSTDIFVLSRLPLTDARQEILTSGAKDSLQVTLEMDHRLMTLTVVHLQRIDSYSGLGGGPALLARAVRTFSTDARDAAVNELMELLRAEGGPQIVVGDLNMTPTSHAYRRLGTLLHDAFLEGGWGLGHTYPTTVRAFGPALSMPLVRIDYILHSSDLVARRSWVGPNGGSDHLPVAADLAFR